MSNPAGRDTMLLSNVHNCAQHLTILPCAVMIIMIMDGSCIAQIFPSRKLNALAHTIHATKHTDINIIYASPHTHISWSA